jgi:hypothetical protein
MFSKVVLELRSEETPAGTALQVFLAAECISLLQISLVIDEFPRTAVRRRQ